MFPVLFNIGAFEIRSYGLMLALSFMLGIWLAVHRSKKWKVDSNIVLDLSLIIIICSIVGARLMYVVFHLNEFKGRWLDTINPVQSTGEIGISGMTVIGGLIFSVIFSLLFLKLKKQPVLKIVDIMAPSVALGIFLTRIGCFLNGCCFGDICEASHGIAFPINSPAGSLFPDQTLIPTQLYSALYGLIMFLVLLFAEKKYYNFNGFTFFLLFTLYGLSRFTIDFFRYYENSMVLVEVGSISISVNQGISLLFTFFFGSLFIYNIVRSTGTRKTT